MAAVGPSYTGLSLLALPGQLPTNIDFPSGADTWSLTDATENAVVVPAVATTDTWTAFFPFEAAQTALFASRSDTWSTSATEGATDLQSTLTRVDTWSASATEGATSIDGNATAITSDDTWTIAGIDASDSTNLVFDYITEFSPRGAPGTQVGAIADKGVPALNPVATDDVWSYTWSESPIDSVQIDVWDSLAARFSAEVASGVSTQDYPALDAWAVAFNESVSVLQLGPVFVELTDTWSATFSAEDSALADGLLDLTDDWSASITETSQVDVTLDTKEVSDTWSAALTLESGSANSVQAVPIISSDEWDVNIGDTAGIVIFGAFAKSASDQWNAAMADNGSLGEVVIQVQARRRIKVDGTIRHVDVE